MARSRKDSWLRDELILALNLYRHAGQKPSLSELDELSEVLRSMPIEPELASDPSFRGRDSVYLKLANFTSLDPTAGRKGMTRGGAGDRRVWEEFSDNPPRLERVAAAIRAHLGQLTPDGAQDGEDGLSEAPEGRILTLAHRVRERNSKLVAGKKAEAMASHGNLACVACRFDFMATYGDHGEGFIECHHTVPVSELKPGARTRLADLALVCSNCHRMIHHRAPWLSLLQLRALLTHQPTTGVIGDGCDPTPT
jgi:5-methylcytosine-specific restriction protein A